MSSVNPEASLPPGFRFHPTDEELVVHYLRRRASNQPLHVTTIIAEVDIYKHDPWKLPDMAQFGDREWYFFTPRDRKYPNGVRPNRAAGSGYWKATGTDRPITSSSPNGAAVEIGVKKALVFYVGKPPKGNKTSWIMHEYRLAGQPAHRGVLQYMHSRGNNGDKSQDSAAGVTSASGNSMRLDDWVLCRIYKKSTASNNSSSHNGAANSIDGASDDAHNEDDTTNNINSNNNAAADGYYGGTHMPTSLPCSLPIQGTAGGDGMLTRPASLSDFLTDVPDYAAFSHLLQDNQHGQLLFGRPLESALTLDPRDHQASSSSTASANQKRQRLLDGNYAVAGYYNNLDGYGGTGGLGSGYHNDNTSALNLNGNMMNNATVSAAMTGFQVTNPFGSGRVGVDQQIIHHHGDLQQHGTTAAPLNAPSHLGFR